jgi:hypothetical protein
MTLSEYYDSLESKSDKGTTHNYINGYYSNEFTAKKDIELAILELGLAGGASIKLWNGWFTNAKIIGIDIEDECIDMFLNEPNIIIQKRDGYCEDTLNEWSDDSFDYIIEDGPHSLESQIFSVKHWIDKIKSGGKLIIEDIQSTENLNSIIEHIDKSKASYHIFDLREDKGRYDDIIIELIKL